MKRVKTGRQLEKALNKALQESTDLTDDFLQDLAFTGLAELQTLTPRRTSFAASMWRVGFGQVGSKPIPNPGGVHYVVTPPSYSQFTRLTIGETAVLYNNTAYIESLDKGSSVQARQGFIEPTYAKLMVIAERGTRKLSREKINV